MKRPNRGSRGHEFGWDTFLQFTKLAAERLELPVKRLVRGHDHVPDRWQEYPEYAENGVPVLTINAMGRALDGDPPTARRSPTPIPGHRPPRAGPLAGSSALAARPCGSGSRLRQNQADEGSTSPVGAAVDKVLTQVTRGKEGAEGAP